MSPAKTISCRKLQASGLVRAATVAAFTRPSVPQLVVFKENLLEVYEVEKEKPILIASTDFWVLVCNCEVLENPRTNACSASTSLDRILVTDDEGKVFILEWSVLTVRDVPINIIKADHDKLEPLVQHSVLSKPLVLPEKTPMSSLMETSRSRDSGAKDWINKIRGVTLVAMSIYQNLIQVVLVAWIPITRYKEKNLEGSISLRPIVNEYLLYMKEESGLINLASQLQKTPSILDLSFIEGLDFKGHPLLVVLSAHDGLVYSLVNIQSYTLDLANRQMQPGPWKISNLHPTTRLLLPWVGDGITRPASWSCERDHVQTGIKQGVGILVISSKSLLFIESSGYRSSLPISLDGLPTCSEVLRDSCLHWGRHELQPVKPFSPFPPAQILKQVQFVKEENGDIAGFVFFLSGSSSNSRLFALLPDLIGREIRTPSLASHDCESMSMLSDLPSLSEEGLSWYTKEFSIEHSSLDDPTSVHSMLLVDDPCKVSEKQILAACGSSPTATLRRGSLGVAFNSDKICDDKIGGLPEVLPMKWALQSHYHTHLLLCYPTEGTTEIVTLDGENQSESMDGLETSECTLAASAVSGDWLFQVTTKSLRVLSPTTPRALVAEWLPQAAKDCSARSHVGAQKNHHIKHASVSVDGAVLSTGKTVYSVKLNKSGRLCPPVEIRRPQEVSALGNFEFWIVGDKSSKPRKQFYAKYLTSPRPAFDNADLFFLVVVAQWVTNTVHLLTWPDLEEIDHVETGSSPVRCVCVTTIGKEQYLFVGTGEGNVLYFQIKYDTPKEGENVDSEITENPSIVHSSSFRDDAFERENVSCLKFMQGLRAPVGRRDTNEQSLKRFNLRLKHGRVLRLGGSVVSIIHGPFCGPEMDSSKKLSRILEKQDCLLVQTDRDSIVLIPGEDGDLQAVCMSGSFTQPLGTSFRIHTESVPNSLGLLSREGQLLFGHVDLSVKLRWRKMEIIGNPQQLGYHRGTGCAVITSNDGGSVRLSLIHVQSMCQVLTLELETDQHPTALEVLELPCVEMKKSRECIVVACQKGIKEQARGTLQFFDFTHAYTCDEELQYELRMLGKHHTELPCQALCLLRKQEESLPTFCCDICNVDSCIDGFEPLSTALKHLTCGGGHWNDYCRDQEGKRGLHRQGGPLLALGFSGRVEIFAVLIGSSIASILLVPPLAQIIKSALPYFPDSVRSSGYKSSSAATVDTDGMNEQTLEGSKGCPASRVDPKPMTSKNSLVCLTRLTTFDSPGRGCVTALLALSSDVILVGEMFQGIGIFSIQENGDVVHLAWHPCSQPLTTVLQLEANLLLVALYEHGLQLMERDLCAEQSFQEEKRLWEEDGDTVHGAYSRRSELRRSGESLNPADGEVRRSEMPSLNPMERCSQPIAVIQMQVGRLGIRTTPISEDTAECTSDPFGDKYVTIITSTGEVAELEIISRSPVLKTSLDLATVSKQKLEKRL
ncbi:hypothetical protein MPTK2_3g13070 [Marchantia polymorpha subsp. ruderalis]